MSNNGMLHEIEKVEEKKTAKNIRHDLRNDKGEKVENELKSI